MLIARIQGSTRQLGAPNDWDGDLSKCHVLPIRDVMTEQGNFMVSAWEPTPAEVEQIKAGQTIKLWIQGTGHPVVKLSVGEEFL